MYAEAVDTFTKAALNAGVDAKKIEEEKEIFRTSGWQAYLQMRKDRMMQVLTRGGYASPLTIAALNARLGNKEEAFTWLDKAVDARASGIPNLKVDPVFDSLHSDVRFAKLLQRMNIAP
ncbi:MAG: hypothetical protein C5B44_03240 [Acidobacteria bacterium]|nr:MAG: hypothetical protein C5B44_03240 [Acidobacteriota bacterium]